MKTQPATSQISGLLGNIHSYSQLTTRPQLCKNATLFAVAVIFEAESLMNTLPLNWPTRQDWINDIMPDFYQHGLAVLPQAIPAQLCQALLDEVSQKIGRAHV